LIRVSIDISSTLSIFFETPCPLKSNASNVPNCLTYFASRAKLIAECPAPWIQKNAAPFYPDLKIDVPF
jgi:hypothetical protein